MSAQNEPVGRPLIRPCGPPSPQGEGPARRGRRALQKASSLVGEVPQCAHWGGRGKRPVCRNSSIYGCPPQSRFARQLPRKGGAKAERALFARGRPHGAAPTKFWSVSARRGGPACPPKTNRSVAPSSGPVGHLPPRGKVRRAGVVAPYKRPPPLWGRCPSAHTGAEGGNAPSVGTA